MILFRYLSRDILLTMLTVAVVVLAVSLGSRFSSYLNEAANGTLSKDVLLMLIALRIPKFLELIIPISFFLSVMLVYGRMHVDSEMVVLESCGISAGQMIRMTLGLSLIVMLLTAAVSLWLKPLAENGAENILAGEKNLTEFDKLAPGRFQTLQSGKRVTYAENTGKDGRLSTVFINEYQSVQGDGPDRMITLMADAGQTRIDANGNRFLVLKDGYRYEGQPGRQDYQIIRYDEYGQLIEQETVRSRAREKTAQPTAKLIGSTDTRDIAELQWRISIILMIPVIAVMAVPLSRVNPRQGRYTRLVPAMILCFLYVLILSSSRSGVARGTTSPETGLWWVHGLFLVITVFLFRIDRLQGIVHRMRMRASIP